MQLKPDADIEQVKKDISQIEFGTGKISVENKITRHEVAEVRNKIINQILENLRIIFLIIADQQLRSQNVLLLI